MLPLRLSESHWQISGPAAAPRPVAVRVLTLRHRRWVPSHWKVLGNEQADRIAKRANNLNIVTNIRNVKSDMLSNIKKRHWQQQYDTYPAYTIKDKI